MVKFMAVKVEGNAVTLVSNGLRVVLTRPHAVQLYELLKDEKDKGNLSLKSEDIMRSLEEVTA